MLGSTLVVPKVEGGPPLRERRLCHHGNCISIFSENLFLGITVFLNNSVQC